MSKSFDPFNLMNIALLVLPIFAFTIIGRYFGFLESVWIKPLVMIWLLSFHRIIRWIPA